MSMTESGSEDVDLPEDESGDEGQDAQTKNRFLPQSSHELLSLSSDDVPSDPSRHGEKLPDRDATTQSSAISGAGTRRPVPLLDHNQFAAEPTYYTRPNRYFGPDSTWLSWTKEERLVAEALDSRRSQDLSIHLFDAYALKQRGRLTEAESKRARKGKERAVSADSNNHPDREALSGFFPPRSWTAWPLPPDQVPRDDDEFRDHGHEIYQMTADPKPSAVLEECIIATTARIAREMWKCRDFEPEVTKSQEMTSRHSKDVEMTFAENAHAIDSDAADTLHTDSGSGSEMFESQPWRVDSKTELPAETTEEDPNSRDTDQRPSPMADEDEIRSILLPGTRHILSKLDSLLTGLHHARHAYATTTYSSTRKRKSITTDSEQGSNNETRYLSKKSKLKGPASFQGSLTKDEEPDATSPTRHSRRNRVQLNPRDWSDVVGMAALTGWDPAVVQRASERCAKLFGENMLFRTFHEGDALRKKPSSFEEHYAVSQSSASDIEDAHLPAATPAVAIRTSRPCKACKANREKCEPFIPPDTSLSIGPTHSGHCIRCGRINHTSCSGITYSFRPKPISPTSKSRRCPYPDCDRRRHPFQSSYHLERHLTKVHKSSPPSSTPPPHFPPSMADPSSRMCPIATCPRHEKGFTRATLLYRHIRDMHPEVDVQEVKKLESKRRGDGRGKWYDERRWRSRSRSRGISENRRGSGLEMEDDKEMGPEETGRGKENGKRMDKGNEKGLRDSDDDGDSDGWEGEDDSDGV